MLGELQRSNDLLKSQQTEHYHKMQLKAKQQQQSQVICKKMFTFYSPSHPPEKGNSNTPICFMNAKDFCAWMWFTLTNYFYLMHSSQAAVAKSRKDLEAVTSRLCEVRRLSISQIQKYLFPIQVNPVCQVLGTPPLKGHAIGTTRGNYFSCMMQVS